MWTGLDWTGLDWTGWDGTGWDGTLAELDGVGREGIALENIE